MCSPAKRDLPSAGRSLLFFSAPLVLSLSSHFSTAARQHAHNREVDAVLPSTGQQRCDVGHAYVAFEWRRSDGCILSNRRFFQRQQRQQSKRRRAWATVESSRSGSSRIAGRREYDLRRRRRQSLFTPQSSRASRMRLLPPRQGRVRRQSAMLAMRQTRMLAAMPHSCEKECERTQGGQWAVAASSRAGDRGNESVSFE